MENPHQSNRFFQEAKAELEDSHQRFQNLFEFLAKRFPAPEGYTWAMNGAGKLALFRLGEEKDDG